MTEPSSRESSLSAHHLASNFIFAMTRWAASGFQVRSESAVHERFAICQQCEHFDAAAERCRQCGCYCSDAGKIVNKLSLATEVCPLGKWD